MKKHFLLACLLSFGIINTTFAEKPRSYNQSFVFVSNTCEGILVSHPTGILKGAPSHDYKKGDRITCLAHWSREYIKDRRGRDYAVWIYERKVGK